MKHVRKLIASAAMLLLVATLVTCAAVDAPVTDDGQAVPSLGASAIEAETDNP